MDFDGNTALMMTTSHSICEALLAADGSSVNLRNRDEKTALMCALESLNCETSVIGLLIKNNADVFTLNRQRNKSPLSILFRKQIHSSHELVCIKEVLAAKAGLMGSPYHCHAVPLIKLILAEKSSLVQSWVDSGAPPGLVCTRCLVAERCVSESFADGLRDYGLNSISPLIAALLSDDLNMAYFFSNIKYLTSMDVDGSIMQRNVYQLLVRLRSPICAQFITKMFSKTESLFNLSLIKVVELLKVSPKRESLVMGMGIPKMLRQSLLFKGVERLGGTDSNRNLSECLDTFF